MNRNPVSDPHLAALGRFQGSIERNSNFRQQALDHNLSRNVKVAKLLGYLALMRQAATLPAGIVECVAAIRQNFSSSRSMTNMGQPTGAMQAAHFLPGQIRIAGKEIAQFSTNLQTRGHIQFLFAEVEHLPVVFNQADSAAESNGLCSALSKACTILIHSQTKSRQSPGRFPLDLVQSAYDEWHRGAGASLRKAIVSKGEKPGVPSLVGDRFEGYTLESLRERSEAGNKLWNRDNSLRILEYYLEDQQQRSWNWVVASCQWAVREVESNFKR